MFLNDDVYVIVVRISSRPRQQTGNHSYSYSRTETDLGCTGVVVVHTIIVRISSSPRQQTGKHSYGRTDLWCTGVVVNNATAFRLAHFPCFDHLDDSPRCDHCFDGSVFLGRFFLHRIIRSVSIWFFEDDSFGIFFMDGSCDTRKLDRNSFSPLRIFLGSYFLNRFFLTMIFPAGFFDRCCDGSYFFRDRLTVFKKYCYRVGKWVWKVCGSFFDNCFNRSDFFLGSFFLDRLSRCDFFFEGSVDHHSFFLCRLFLDRVILGDFVESCVFLDRFVLYRVVLGKFFYDDGSFGLFLDDGRCSDNRCRQVLLSYFRSRGMEFFLLSRCNESCFFLDMFVLHRVFLGKFFFVDGAFGLFLDGRFSDMILRCDFLSYFRSNDLDFFLHSRCNEKRFCLDFFLLHCLLDPSFQLKHGNSFLHFLGSVIC
mmetsp:Transcript_44152/g.49221  ORF Transcript_44152/g.49221 Transcript_44152/m.49221 type:complete len:423 (+) Transcript_44152:598-1866(+)